MSCRRNGPREQVTKAEEGTLELRGKRGKETVRGGGGGAVGGSVGVLHREPLQSAVYVTDLCKVLDVSEVQVTV